MTRANPCAWCQAEARIAPAPGESHGICRYHELVVLAKDGMATPDELRELAGMDPRPSARYASLDAGLYAVTWAIITLSAGYLLVHVCVWSCLGLRVVG